MRLPFNAARHEWQEVLTGIGCADCVKGFANVAAQASNLDLDR